MISSEYDIIGNMTKKTSSQSVTPGRNKPELNYALDYTYSLTRTHSALKIGDYGYQYDANGNVTAEIYGTTGRVARRTGSSEFEDSDDADPTIGHVMYNFSDVHPDNPTPGTVVKSYVWDEENRMKEAVNGREHVYFGYDAGGERTVKWSEHGETVYLDRMYQVETSTHPALYTKHIFVGDTRLVSRIGDEGGSYGGQDGEMYYYHADHLGSSNWVTDNKEAEYEHLEYAPYGESWVEEGRDSLNRIDHLFTGKELDDETGLYYFGARYMDPKTSRWMSSDPAVAMYLPEAPVDDEAKKRNGNLPGMGGVFNTVNLATYHYAGNNPLKYVDPNGSDSICAQWSGGMWWLCLADGPVPAGDAVYVVGIIVTGVIDLVTLFGPQLPGVIDEFNRAIDNISNSASNMPDPGNKGWDKFKEIVDKIRRIKYHLDSEHLEGAKKELQGEITKLKSNGIPYDHVTEVANYQQGLKNQIIELNKLLGDPNLSQEQRNLLQQTLSETSKFLDKTEEFLK
jgi:RHS repeat-associated protein